MVKSMLTDTLSGIMAAQTNKSIAYLSNGMRDAIVSGIDNALASICDLAWDYYTIHDVPEDPSFAAVLRTIVEYHYEKGA